MKPPVDWRSNESHWFVNPKLPVAELQSVRIAKENIVNIPGVIWIRSSGSTARDGIRFVALKKSAFLESARAVNQHIQASSDDVWLKVLPNFHVGGLAQWARATESSSQLIELDQWDVDNFCLEIKNHMATLSALVPTQVFDLVKANKKAPATLRAVIVGGDQLDPQLYHQGRELGWPLLPSYGMTEVASQIATASLESLSEGKFPQLEVLPHLNVHTDSEEILQIDSKALFLGDLLVDSQGLSHWSPRDQSQCFQSEDRVILDAGTIVFLERKSEMLKVKGELVSLQKIKKALEQIVSAEDKYLFKVFAGLSDRDGAEVLLVVEANEFLKWEKVVKRVNEKLAPYERMNSIYFVDVIPRSQLGKPRVAEVLKKLRR